MTSPSTNIHQLTDHLFRHEAGKMVAILTKIFGTEHLETAEDVVQDTLLQAMQVWRLKGVPDNPSAWLFRAAKNKAIDVIRKNKHTVRYDFSDNEKVLLNSEYTLNATMDNLFKEELVKDDMLRMMYACCHPEISAENQITLILKTLCGFSTAEIAHAFLTGEDTVSKRLYRTKEFFREKKIKPEIPSGEELKLRTNAVLNSIYLLFNEGYNSTHSEKLIRTELMEEAMLLCKLVHENKQTQFPEAYALMALMCFHRSRNKSRLNHLNEIILLKDQDRSKWDAEWITLGIEYMNEAAFGETASTYHLEAAIAFEHCATPTFELTNWERIVMYYNWLYSLSPSAIIHLNKAAAIMQWKGAEEALQELENYTDKTQLENYYLYHSLLGEIFTRLSVKEKAQEHFQKALHLTQSQAEQKLLSDKIKAL